MMTTKELVNALRGLYVTVNYAKYIEPGLNFESLSKAADRLEELESKQENLIDYNADLNNRLNKAESYIEKLEKQLAKKQPEWISVEDRLPEKKDELCLVYRKGGNICLSVHYCETNHYWSYDGVTHWMPLPEPPKPKKVSFRDDDDFRRMIKRERLRRNMTQERVAIFAQMSSSEYSKLERGAKRVTPALRKRICDVYGWEEE